MPSILTLTIGEFSLVHDVLSLLIAAMGAAALFFILSRKQVAKQFQPLLILAGIIAAIGCYHATLLFHSWNEAFELAGNSYAASGHFFHELYRYTDWVLTKPLLLIELVLILNLPQEKTVSFFKRLIGAALIAILFAYLEASSLGEHENLMQWSYWTLGLIPLLYLAQVLIHKLPLETAGRAASEKKFFLKARNLFLVSWAFYPVASFVVLYRHGFAERELIIFLIGASFADFLSKCGVSFYIYRIALCCTKSEIEDVSQNT